MKMRSVDSAGRPLDHVTDVRLEERDDGWLVTHVVVGRAAVAQRLGFIHGVVERPLLLARAMRWIGRHSRLVSWEKISLEEGGVVRVAARREDLPPPEGQS